MIAHLIDPDTGAEAQFDLPRHTLPRTWLARNGRMWSWQHVRDRATPKGEIIAVYHPAGALDITHLEPIPGSVVRPRPKDVSQSASPATDIKEAANG